MGWMRGRVARCAALGLAGGWLAAAACAAAVSTEQSASILIFPAVFFGAAEDTVIQISNTSNSIVYAHCFYVNGALEDPTKPPGADNRPLWQEVDFAIVLTKQQPTHWTVSEGRVTDPFDPSCSPTNTDCSDAGFDPGRIPPVAPGFRGELKCIEVDQSGAPISGNHLKGEATLLLADEAATEYGDAAKYNAIGIAGLDSNDSDNTLCLGGTATVGCPAGAEYEGCPTAVLVNHFADGAADPVLAEFGVSGSSVESILTVVPCAQNFETQEPVQVRVQFAIFNEFEEPFSTSTTVDCWGDFPLAGINPVFTVGSLGSRFVQTRVRPAVAESGFVALLRERHETGGGLSVSAVNLHVAGERDGTDLIVIPEGP